MRQLKLITLCVFFFGFCTNINAQFWKKLQKKLEKKVEQKVEEKIDKESDKVIDDALNGKPKKKEPVIIQSGELPKFVGGSGILKITDVGYEYITEDIAISVYGEFTKENISKSVKTYNQDKIIAPVDAYPKGYALAFNSGGYLNTKKGQIIIHHADATKIVFSLKGTWKTITGDKPVAASFVNLSVSDVFNNTASKKIDSNNIEENNHTESNEFSDLFNNNQENTDPEIPDTFSFTSSLKVQISSNGEKSLDMDFLIGKYSKIYGMAIHSEDMDDGNVVYNVITPETVTMFMNVGGMKIKKSASQKQYAQADFSDKVPTNSSDLKKTGATKSILGYTCYEYKYTEDADYTSIWVTKDFPFQETYIGMLGMAENSSLEGFVLEMDMKYGKEKSNIKAIEFNKNKKFTIYTNEYKSLGF